MLSTVTRFVAVGGRLTAVEVQQSGVFFRETPRAAAVTGTAAGDGGTELCAFRARAPLPRGALPSPVATRLATTTAFTRTS